MRRRVEKKNGRVNSVVSAHFVLSSRLGVASPDTGTARSFFIFQMSFRIVHRVHSGTRLHTKGVGYKRRDEGERRRRRIGCARHEKKSGAR